jgi:hypothetical protein
VLIDDWQLLTLQLHYEETALRQELEAAGHESQETERLAATTNSTAALMEHIPTFPGMQLEQLIERSKTVHVSLSIKILVLNTALS